MFRHTTKQTAKSQERRKAEASAALDRDRQILCSSIYDNTYGVPLPAPSIEMLNNIVTALTGCNSEVEGRKRKIYTIAKFCYGGGVSVSLCFIQPEISSSTAVVKSSCSGALARGMREAAKDLNNPAPARITTSKEKCQIMGRLAPYAVEASGITEGVLWTYFNASKSRLFYVVSSREGYKLMSPTEETMLIYQSFRVRGCAMVFASSTRCFKITASPTEGNADDNPNKSTCVSIYSDGTYKVLGTPHKSYQVCKVFRETLVRAHTSRMHERVIGSLTGLEDIGFKPKG